MTFASGFYFVYITVSKQRYMMPYYSTGGGVRSSTEYECGVKYRSAKIRLELPDSRTQSRSRPARNIQEHHRQSSVFNSGEISMGCWKFCSFDTSVYCRKFAKNDSRLKSCSWASMIYDCLVPVPVMNMFNISEKEF